MNIDGKKQYGLAIVLGVLGAVAFLLGPLGAPETGAAMKAALQDPGVIAGITGLVLWFNRSAISKVEKASR